MTICGVMIVALALVFWSGSRYPQLNEKALMGGDAQTEDPLSFDSVIQIQPTDGLVRRIGISTLNWAAENRQGMTFGILLGAAFLTLFNLFSRRGSNNRFVNALIGLGAGAPLGVCVNCAAPIARGLHSSGARLETTLAAMFSSPTLNVVIITMLISIFPPYLVAIKLALTVVFILFAVPLLGRTVFRNESVATYDDSVCPVPPPMVPLGESWFTAFRRTVVEYLKNLWFIIKTTLPLMALAGLLAAIAVHTLPMNEIVGLDVTWWAVLLVALAGIFLPVPIALDLVIAASLLAAGFPMIYVGILLFTLGIYSVYSFSIVWTAVSLRVAAVLGIVLVGFGIVAGLISEWFYQRELAAVTGTLDLLN